MLKNKMKIIFFLMCLSSVLHAQDAYFNNYPQNHFWYNPAYAGVDSTHEFSLSGRTQWSSNYNTVMLSYDQPLEKIHSGIGAKVLYDRSGSAPMEKQYGALCYNYKIHLADEMNLRIGMQAAFDYLRINTSGLIFGAQYTDTGYVNTPTTDFPLLIENYSLDFGAGIWYTFKNFYAGFSTQHISNPLLKISYGTYYSLSKNYISTAGYKFKLGKHFSTIPSAICMLQVPSKFFEVSNDFVLNETYYLGAGFRGINNLNRLTARGGIKWKKKFQVMVAVDFSVPSELATYSQNFVAYEANLKYMFR